MQLGSLWVRSRNFMAEFFDIVIVGGGPAGSTAGTLLAKHGWNVAILEKEKFPRFKIGESLLPGSLCTFERMGVREKIDQADVIVKYGGKIVSACGTRSNRFLFSDVFRYMLDRTLRQPQRRAAEFARHERQLGRVPDLYLKFVTAWYTQEFAEVFFHPKEFFQLVPAVNSVLAGSEQRTAEVRWRLWVFDFLVFLQKRFALIAPRMNLQPK
jgi:Tryptophan halogenase